MQITRTPTSPRFALRSAVAAAPAVLVLAAALAIVMPVIEALVYPTYMHTMRLAWVEWTRLQELPYVLFEVLVIMAAMARGMTLRSEWDQLPRDVRPAVALLLAGVFIGSIFTSSRPAFTIATSCITVINLVFAIAALFFLRRSGTDGVSKVMPLLAIGLVVLSCYTAIRFAFPPPAHLVWGGVIEWPSAIPGFISVRHFGSWSGAIAAGFAVHILFRKESREFDWNYVFYAVAAAVTVWTGTRAAILAMVFVVGVACLSLRRLPSFAAIGRAAILTGIALVAAYVLLPEDPTFRLFHLDDYSTLRNASAGRDGLWEQTFRRWLESPWFGWGTGSTFWEVYIGWPHTQPHNAVLQFLISWGVVGASGALYLLGRAILRVHAPGMSDPDLRPLLAVLYALLFQSLLEGMLHYPRFINAIFFLFALIIVHGGRQGTAGAGRQ